jgi:enoyl-CoA hydratase
MSEAPNPVRVERLPGHVAWVKIDRPEARNAINAAVARGLEAAIDETETDSDVWVVILGSAGSDVFCAGADLKEVSAGRGKTLMTERGGFAGFVHRDRSKPWIAAIDGKAFAGGMEIALACDLLVAGEQATFALPEVMRGLMAAAGGLYRLPRAIAPNIATELILTGGQLGAMRAHQLGLVNRLAASGQLRESALALAAEIAKNSPVAVRESLRVIRRARDFDEDALREMTHRAFAAVAASEDFKEGPRAFIEKRAPRWTGR